MLDKAMLENILSINVLELLVTLIDCSIWGEVMR